MNLTQTLIAFFRNMLMRAFHLLVMMVIGDRVRDTQCGFKVRHTAHQKWFASGPG